MKWSALVAVATAFVLTSPLRGDDGKALPRSSQQSHHLLAATSSIDWTHDVTFAYDSSGNIRAIGADRYYYDTAGRLGYGSVEGSANTQAYCYDPFGNRITVTTATAVGCVGSCGVNAPADPTTNHLYSAVYDDAGSVRTSDGATYTYDGEAMIKHASDSGADFVYTADGERIATVRAGLWSWNIRDLTGRTLSTFRSQDAGTVIATGGLTWTEDHIYRGGQLLAALLPSGTGTTTKNFHVDHLGTPRLITDATGHRLASHSYFPFGAELALSPTESPLEAKKFTGHERDSFNTGHDLDYMHARYYGASVGRFLSIDPVLGNQTSPQSWNRYSYADDNPIAKLDANGRQVAVAVPGLGPVGPTVLVLYHVYKMATDPTYRHNAVRAVTNVAAVSGGLTTALVVMAFKTTMTGPLPSLLMANTKDDGKSGAVPGPGVDPKPRQLGERAKEGSVEDAIDQLDSVRDKQRRIRQGIADGIIHSTGKSEQNVRHELGKIESLDDVKEPDADTPKEEENGDRQCTAGDELNGNEGQRPPQ